MSAVNSCLHGEFEPCLQCEYRKVKSQLAEAKELSELRRREIDQMKAELEEYKRALSQAIEDVMSKKSHYEKLREAVEDQACDESDHSEQITCPGRVFKRALAAIGEKKSDFDDERPPIDSEDLP